MAGLPGVRIVSIFSYQNRWPFTKFAGWMSLERVTLTEKKLKQVMFVQDVHHSPVTCVDVEGMKRAGWTEVEIPEDLHEMVTT